MSKIMELADAYTSSVMGTVQPSNHTDRCRAALQAEVERMEAALAQWKHEAMTGSNAQMLRDQNEKLEAEIAALREDAERLDWLESSDVSHGFCHMGNGDYRHYAHQTEGYKTVRQVIDAARSKR